MGLHPATVILFWLTFALAMGRLTGLPLRVLAVVLLVASLLLRRPALWKALRRLRFVLLSLILIYGFATPGIPLVANVPFLSPTLEGLREGTHQMLRVFCLLAWSTLLVGGSRAEDLLVGVYTVLRPLSYVGIGAEKIAVRLWLTLRYVEDVAQRGWRENLQHLGEPGTIPPDTESCIQLPNPPFSWRDGCALGCLWGVAVVALA
jgi:energy-coupling factor transporter transmembrane protein EcfT